MLIWTPEKNEPQVTSEAFDRVSAQLETKGVKPLIWMGRRVINDPIHESLRSYIDYLGFEFNCESDEGDWPFRAFKTGGAIAVSAYRASGYKKVIIDEKAVVQGRFMVELNDAIPEAFSLSLYEDDKLATIIRTVATADTFYMPDGDGYYQVMGYGAGCVRFFMEQALAAA